MKLSFSTLEEMLSAFDVIDADQVSSPEPGKMLIARNIRTFKQWSLVPLSDLNLLTGPNSSGKSTIIDVLKFFSSRKTDDLEHFNTTGRIVVGFSSGWREFAEWDMRDPLLQKRYTLSSMMNFVDSLEGVSSSGYKTRFRRFTWLMEVWPGDDGQCWGIYVFGDQRCLGQFVSGGSYENFFALRIMPELYVGRSNEIFEKTVTETLGSMPKFIKFNVGEDAGDLYYETNQFFPPGEPLYIASGSNDFDFDEGPYLAFDDDSDVGAIKALLVLTFNWFYLPIRIIENGLAAVSLVPALRSIPTSGQLEFLSISEIMDFSEKRFPEQRIYEEIARALIKNRSKYLTEVNTWLKKLLATDYSLDGVVKKIVERRSSASKVNKKKKIDARYSVKLHLTVGNDLKLGFADVGTGVSQVVPVVALLLSLDDDDPAVLQQPELHLHPKAQSVLADLFLTVCSRGHQITIETHSEHIILRIIRRLGERGSRGNQSASINPSQLRIVYFHPGPNGSEPHWIRVDDAGRFLDPWPAGFFEERYEDLFFERSL
jgi:predicted ATPase